MKNIKGIIALVIVIILILALVVACVCDSHSNKRGDGSSSCKNCGRSPVYDLGYCKTCYKGFIKYQNNNNTK